MNLTYEKSIVLKACLKLKNLIGIIVRPIDVYEKTLVMADGHGQYEKQIAIVMDLEFGQNKHKHSLSCLQDTFYDTKRAADLPLITQLVSQEQLANLDEQSIILLCFSAWFYKLGLHYKYF